MNYQVRVRSVRQKDPVPETVGQQVVILDVLIYAVHTFDEAVQREKELDAALKAMGPNIILMPFGYAAPIVLLGFPAGDTITAFIKVSD